MKTTNWVIAWVMAIIVCTGAAFSQSTPAASQAYKIEETRLGQLDKDILTPAMSSDGRHLAFVTRRDGKFRVVVDGKGDADYDGIGPPIFSPDGKRVAYGAKNGQKWSVVVDGQAGAEYGRIAEGPSFSPDGKHVAYAAKNGQKGFVVVDG